ncbi:hypothetical protein THAOC_22650, partial [Thalassiosira oceanica]
AVESSEARPGAEGKPRATLTTIVRSRCFEEHRCHCRNPPQSTPRPRSRRCTAEKEAKGVKPGMGPTEDNDQFTEGQSLSGGSCREGPQGPEKGVMRYAWTAVFGSVEEVQSAEREEGLIKGARRTSEEDVRRHVGPTGEAHRRKVPQELGGGPRPRHGRDLR